MGQILILTLLTFLFSFSAKAKLINTSAQTDAVYGIDDREFVNSSSDRKIKKLARSVALIVSKDTIETHWFSSIINAGLLSDNFEGHVCADTKFRTHHSLNSCTGFLIAPDLLVSAGHCFMSKDDCANKTVIFEVQSKNEISKGYKISTRAVYECKEIVKSAFNSEGPSDFSIIRLNKKVIDREPLKIRKSGTIQHGDSVFMIGHPMGLPQMLSPNALVNDIQNEHLFKATLDSFEGNSGSPVFNAETLEVEGILVRGEDDFVEDQSRQCYRYQTYEEVQNGGTSLKGEGITRISDLFPL